MTSKKQSHRGFFDEQEKIEKLNKLKAPLDKLSNKIDFERFRETFYRMEIFYKK